MTAPTKIGIAAKLSKIQWDMHRLGLSYDQVLRRLDKEGMNVDGIVKSHRVQNECIDAIIDAVPNAEKIDLLGMVEGKAQRPRPEVVIALGPEEQTMLEFMHYDLGKQFDITTLLAIGGDNFFQLASHFFGDAMIVAVNSDVRTSHGGLLYFDFNSLMKNLDKIARGDVDVEEWARVMVTLNGTRVPDARCTASLAIKATDMISRYMLSVKMDESDPRAAKYNAKQRDEEQKCTGLLVVSGAGSGQYAWYRNAGLYLPMIKGMNFRVPTREFHKTSRQIRTLTREALGGEECPYKYLNMRIPENKRLELTYWSNNPSELSIDSIHRYEVKEGDRLTYRVSDKVLRVARPN